MASNSSSRRGMDGVVALKLDSAGGLDEGVSSRRVDDLVQVVLARHPIELVVAQDQAMRAAAFGLRDRAVLEHGWDGHADEDGWERDV